MSAKLVFVLCAQVFLSQYVLCQCTSRAAVATDPEIIGNAAYGLGAPYGIAEPILAAPNGLEPCSWAGPLLTEPYGLTAPAYTGYGFNALDFTPTSGGSLPVTSSSAIPPVGISVVSDNAYEGILAVTGELPFVGTVAMDGIVPSAGAGAINHACGNGISAMVSDITAFTPGYAGAYVPGLSAPAHGYGAEWLDRGCGYV